MKETYREALIHGDELAGMLKGLVHRACTAQRLKDAEMLSAGGIVNGDELMAARARIDERLEKVWAMIFARLTQPDEGGVDGD